MICLICRQIKVVDSRASVSFQRGEIHLLVNNVPARVCLHCGEAYVGEEVAARLLQGAEAICKAGILEDVIEYEKLCSK